jgi:cell division protein FtsQ
MAKFNTYLKPILYTLLGLGIVAGMFYLNNKSTQKQRCKDIQIEIVSNKEGRFVTKRAIEKLLTDSGKSPVKDVAFVALSLENLEQKVLANRLVEQCQISVAHNGSLLVKVIEKVPVARIIAQEGSSANFKGFYVDKTGGFFPLSSEFSDRTMLLSGAYLIGKRNLKKDKDLLELLNKINDDAYLKSMFSHCMVDQHQNLSFITNLGGFVVEFGQPEPSKFNARLAKLNLFLEQIDNAKLNKYTNISVKYSGQIVCAPFDSLYTVSTTVKDSISTN